MTTQDYRTMLIAVGAVTTILSASITIYEAYKYFSNKNSTTT